MKLLGLIVLAFILGILFFGPNKPDDSVLKNFQFSRIKSEAGKAAKNGISLAEKQVSQFPVSSLVDSTVGRIVNQVSSDAATVVADITSMVIVNKMIDSFKNLSPQAQQQFRNTICK